jgi:hypothetical protein
VGVISCQLCGADVTLPEGKTKGKTRCDTCGSYTEITGEIRQTPAPAPAVQKPKQTKNAADFDDADHDAYETAGETDFVSRSTDAGTFDIPKPARSTRTSRQPKKTRDEDDEDNQPAFVDDDFSNDDDGKPYALPPEADQPCPQCERLLPAKATTCAQCGYDAEAIARAKKIFKPIFREWDSGLTLEKRFQIFSAFLVLDAITFIYTIIKRGASIGDCVGLLMMVGLQAFLFGTFDRLSVRRNEKGKTKLTTTWRVCFIPRAPETIAWREFPGVRIVHRNEPGLTDWAMVFVLLPMLIIPAILWWWYVIRADRYDVHLCGVHGTVETCIHRSRDMERSRDVVSVVADACVLQDQSAR